MLTRQRFFAAAAVFALGALLDLGAMAFGWQPLLRAVDGFGFYQSNGFEGELHPWWIESVVGAATLVIPVIGALLSLIGVSGSLRPGVRPQVARSLRWVVAAWAALAVFTPVMVFVPGDAYRQSTLDFVVNHFSLFLPVWWALHFVPQVLLKLKWRALGPASVGFVAGCAVLLGVARVMGGF